jgi:hypothetical protein
MHSKQPCWKGNLMKRSIKTAAREAIHKNIGWHTFSHFFDTLFKANGGDSE